jgi:nucleoside-diphosphate-sugar epimerase
MTDRQNSCAMTGSTGYVGSILAQALRKQGPLLELVRTPRKEGDVAWSLESEQELAATLHQHRVETLVHAAWDMRASSYETMERICVRGSARLFQAATEAGVRRIVFLSTISAFAGCRSAYGRSKLAVEGLLAQHSGIILRPGLVFGTTLGETNPDGTKPGGGVFGSIRKQVRSKRVVPLIGSGRSPQYLLHEETLAQTVARAARGEFDRYGSTPITLAHPQPWPFAELVRSIAAAEGRRITLLPVPWRLLYAGLRSAEALQLEPPFRSDSVLSFVHYDRHPDFSMLAALGIDPIPYHPRAAVPARQEELS